MNGKNKNWFHVLSKLSNCDKNQLLEYYGNDDLIDIVSTAATEIDDAAVIQRNLSEEQFVDFILRQCNLLRKWARKLDNAIILSGEHADRNEFHTAISILKKFISVCPSPFLEHMLRIK